MKASEMAQLFEIDVDPPESPCETTTVGAVSADVGDNNAASERDSHCKLCSDVDCDGKCKVSPYGDCGRCGLPIWYGHNIPVELYCRCIEDFCRHCWQEKCDGECYEELTLKQEAAIYRIFRYTLRVFATNGRITSANGGTMISNKQWKEIHGEFTYRLTMYQGRKWPDESIDLLIEDKCNESA